MRIAHSVILCFIIAGIFGCQKDVVVPVSEFQLNGLIQKGPFVIGSKVNLVGLNASLTETGKIFTTNTTDDKGAFSIKTSELTTNFVSLTAEGIYFDEVAGTPSATKLTLGAIADSTSFKKINVNVLTQLEMERIKYLVSKGASFPQAKAQTEKEILKIFVIDNVTKGFEMLDISQTGSDNAALLAVSLILQGSHTVAQLTDLLAKISADLKTDGTLDMDALKSELMNEAQLLNTANVRQNITSKYSILGGSATIGAFEPIIENFKAKSGYAFTKKIAYPTTSGSGKPNLLAMSDTVFETSNAIVLGLKAVMPSGTSMILVVRPDTNTYSNFNFSSSNYGGWNYSQARTTLPTIVSTSTNCDTEISIDPHTSNNSINSFTLEIYENGSSSPTKKIKVKVSELSKAFNLSSVGKNGVNFLNSGNLAPNTKGDFGVQVAVSDTKGHTVTIVFDYITPAQNSLNLSNLEGWSVFNEVLSGQKYLYRTTLILPASKNNGDAKLNISGFGQMSMTGSVDGVTKNTLTKTYEWQ